MVRAPIIDSRLICPLVFRSFLNQLASALKSQKFEGCA
jgi:hypothetical protein